MSGPSSGSGEFISPSFCPAEPFSRCGAVLDGPGVRSPASKVVTRATPTLGLAKVSTSILLKINHLYYFLDNQYQSCIICSWENLCPVSCLAGKNRPASTFSCSPYVTPGTHSAQ